MKDLLIKTRKSKGITLVALVVTIIVLLILAAVSINLVLGENGIIKRSKEAKMANEKDSIKESAELIKTDLVAGNLSDNNRVNINILLEKIKNEFEGSKIQGPTLITSDNKYQISVAGDFEISVVENNNIVEDGKLGLEVYYKNNGIHIYPFIGGVESYKQYAERKLLDMTRTEIEDLYLTSNGITREEIEETINSSGCKDFYEYFQQYFNGMNIEDSLIEDKVIEGYDYEDYSIEVTLSNGSKKTINYPEESYLDDYVTEDGEYTITAKYQEQMVSKTVNAKINIVDQSHIFIFDEETGYITGIKPEYISFEKPEMISAFSGAREVYLTCGAPFLIIPESINGVTVKGIGEYSLEGFANVHVVVLPNTIERIDKNAFAFTKIKTIELPSSLTFIGDRAFLYTEIENLYIPSTVTTIGDYAFFNSFDRTINCEVAQKPDGWDAEWFGENGLEYGGEATIVWGVSKN